MKIEAGKYYRRADGKKAGPAFRGDDTDYPFVVKCDLDSAHNVMPQGWFNRRGEPYDREPDAHLIAEWSDQPPLNTLIEWDGSAESPVPVGTDLTYWDEDGLPNRVDGDAGNRWVFIVAYLVHSYPPKEERVECCRSAPWTIEQGTCIIRDGEVDWSTWEPKP